MTRRKAPRPGGGDPAGDIAVHTRADLDRQHQIYSLEFSDAELRALADGIVPASVQAVITLVLTPSLRRVGT
jgi:hypothetical protein